MNMIINEPKYSILIPTRNGAPYVISAVRSVLDLNYPSCEVVVSVNHSNDNTIELLKTLNDSRLRVITPPCPLSMAGHYEWGLRQLRGQWLTILGDDDAVMPYFFEEVDSILEKNKDINIEAISSRRAYYFWPGCEQKYGNTVISYKATERVSLIKSSWALFSVFAGCREHYDLPQIYTNNIVKKAVVDRIRQASNEKFYHELTPDVYSGVVVALSIDKYLRTEKPLFWTGTSLKSIGLSIADKPADKLPSRAKEHFAMSQEDGLGISKNVSSELWHGALSSPIYAFSAFCSVPNLPEKWHKRKKLIRYLVYSDLLLLAVGLSATKSIGKTNIGLAKLTISDIVANDLRVWMFAFTVPSIAILKVVAIATRVVIKGLDRLRGCNYIAIKLPDSRSSQSILDASVILKSLED